MVGGTALSAYGVRALSEDVDLFVRNFSVDIVAEIEAEARSRHGQSFKLDVTPAENLRGTILVRDIDQDARTVVRRFDVDERRYEIRAISIETQFLLKLAAGRERDREDLPLIAAKTSPDALVTRFNTLVAWHGDRDAVAAFADGFVNQLCSLFGCKPLEIIERLKIPAFVRRMLWEVHDPTR
jgi:predicted nucleotidyltransferase